MYSNIRLSVLIKETLLKEQQIKFYTQRDIDVSLQVAL